MVRLQYAHNFEDKVTDMTWPPRQPRRPATYYKAHDQGLRKRASASGPRRNSQDKIRGHILLRRQNYALIPIVAMLGMSACGSAPWHRRKTARNSTRRGLGCVLAGRNLEVFPPRSHANALGLATGHPKDAFTPQGLRFAFYTPTAAVELVSGPASGGGLEGTSGFASATLLRWRKNTSLAVA